MFLCSFRNRRQETDFNNIRTVGLRVDLSSKDPSLDENGVPILIAGLNYTIRLFGKGFTENTLVVFTKKRAVHGSSCQYPATGVFPVSIVTISRRKKKCY